MPALDARDLELFAVNTGDLYDIHCLMGSKGCTLAEWHYHITSRVIPQYAKDVKVRFAFATDRTKNEVAAYLKDYYEAHVKEL